MLEAFSKILQNSPWNMDFFLHFPFAEMFPWIYYKSVGNFLFEEIIFLGCAVECSEPPN